MTQKLPKDLPEPDPGSVISGGHPEWVVTFELPSRVTPALVELAKDIVRIDHRSLHTLPPKSRERGEIRDLLVNVVVFLQSGQADAGRSLLQHAEAVYQQHVQARNRLRYLLGMLMGIFAMFIIGVGFVHMWGVLNTMMPTQVLPLVLLFAGMGAVTSVLTRLSSIDLRDQTSLQMVYIAGVARPITAVFLALVVSLVLALRIVDFNVGVANDETVPPALFLIAAFLCGFSERFAKDVLARVGGHVEGSGEDDASAPEPEAPHRSTKRDKEN